MLMQCYNTTVTAEPASGRDPNTASAARLWARVLCGLAAITDLFPALRTRLLNHLCNVPSVSNTDSNASDRDADAAAKGDTDRKMDSSKSGKSPDRGKGKNGDGQVWQCSKDKPRGGKRNGKGKNKGRDKLRCVYQNNLATGCKGKGKNKGSDKGKGNGKNKVVNNSNTDGATPKGMMKVLAGSLCMNLGLFCWQD